MTGSIVFRNVYQRYSWTVQSKFMICFISLYLTKGLHFRSHQSSQDICQMKSLFAGSQGACNDQIQPPVWQKKKKKKRKRKKLIRRNIVRPSQEKLNVMIAFYKILTVPRKKINLKWAFTHRGSPWDIIFCNGSNAEGFFRPLPIRTYVSNKCRVQYLWIPSYSADREPVEKNCSRKKGHPPSWERRWPWAKNTRACSDCLALTAWGDLGEPNCFEWEKSARLGGWPG